TMAVSGGTLNANSIVQSSVGVSSNGRVNIAANGTDSATSVVNSLTFSGGGKFDLSNNTLIVDYTGGSPASSIRAALVSGSAGGSWNGAGLNSSTAAAAPANM